MRSVGEWREIVYCARDRATGREKENNAYIARPGGKGIKADKRPMCRPMRLKAILMVIWTAFKKADRRRIVVHFSPPTVLWRWMARYDC